MPSKLKLKPSITRKQYIALRKGSLALLSDAPPEEIKQALLKLIGTFDIPAKEFISLKEMQEAMEQRQLRSI